MQFSGVAIDLVIYPQFRTSRLFQSAGWIILIGTVASIYPAMRAATIDAMATTPASLVGHADYH